MNTSSTLVSLNMLYYFFGIIVIMVLVFTVLGNIIVLWIYIKNKDLNSSIRKYLIARAVSDIFCASAAYWMNIGSAFSFGWNYGTTACAIHAVVVCDAGIFSIILMATIAVEQAIATLKPIMYRNTRAYHQTFQLCVITLSALIATALSIGPSFGWGTFAVFGTVKVGCSFDYLQRDISSSSYYFTLMILGFIVPLTVIVVSYALVLIRILPERMNPIPNQQHALFMAQNRRFFGTFVLLLTIIIVYLVAWTPFAIITIIGQLGPVDSVSSGYSIYFAELCAKTFTLYNPIIYGLVNKQFRLAFCVTILKRKTGCVCSKSPRYTSRFHTCMYSRVSRNSRVDFRQFAHTSPSVEMTDMAKITHGKSMGACTNYGSMHV